MSASSPAKSERPLSPHLQVYKLIPTMAMSIVHRITGGALYVGTLLFAWWLIAAASGPDYFATVNGFLGSWFGLLVLFGFTWALIHHMLGGLRHFVWDLGYLFEKHTATKLAWATLAGSITLTLVIWIAGAALQ
ncbi:succinate dehydrogenase, cytochrome b556 subunit [Oricola thermophila]|uniref:Succinate dehydrogenase cytochrome b556 subunit n=1 Tax=Oricola thermophila TaxID=2742145 RepID=A0A6N1VKN5_9HYPH|nr:succinate dehydrogenase, cytochrome b556 subunit [Oricola thermophila]QKV19972.1 succinate dehydrogenase, cytochrome b556 subunit [Oricola thermophila]